MMKSITHIALMAMSIVLYFNENVFGTQAAKSLFEKANTCYKQQQFSEALKNYQAIENKSPAVFFNIGNCMFRLNQLGSAICYWHKAERNWGIFGKSELYENIKIAQEKLKINNRQKEKSRSPIIFLQHFFKSVVQFIVSFANAIPSIYLQLLFFIFWIALFGLAYKQNISYYSSLRSGVLVCLMILFVLLTGKYYAQNRSIGIIITPQAELYSGPGIKYQQLGTLTEGQPVTVRKTSAAFVKIYANGHNGWINVNNVEKI